ncbi:hypothetical protein C8Q75DRAFT_580348 [Abortiporus biennis]|nr:hypothetical protein C8Q75DRAFT_580348 [Abortiporus biennis]
MFEKCPNLKNVNFASVESFRGFDHRRRMSRSILPNQHTLQHLRSLTISNVGADVSAMLRGLTAPLVHIDFEQFPHSGEYPTDIGPKDPVPLLANFTSTLEELELCWCGWEDSWDMNSVHHGIRCPKVHTLRTSYDWVPITPTLIYVFPNLKRLDVFNESPVNDFRDMRRSNQEYLQQLVLMGVRDRKNYHWETLEELTGDKGSLFALALTCKVDRLEVDSCMADDIPSLQHILVDTEPSRLRLGLQGPSTIFATEMDNNFERFRRSRTSSGNSL